MSTVNSADPSSASASKNIRKRSHGMVKLAAFGVLSLGTLALVFGPMVSDVVGEVAASSKRAIDWAAIAKVVGAKFEGSSVCASASCHGGGADKAPKDRKAAIANAASVWSGNDKHSNAFKTLSNKQSATIATALKLGDAKAAEACLECHAVKGVTADLKGTGFSLAEGNSCNSCHGPSSKWDKPHATAGWTQARRDEFHDHDKLLNTWGIYDTKPLAARTEMCAGCHLQIPAEMVKAGHPAPNFEIGYFSEVEPRHWIAEPDFDGAKAWLIGQTICLNDAMDQLAARAGGADKSADLITGAYTQAAAHLWVLRDAADAFGLDKSALTAHAAKLKDLAAKPADNAAAIASEATATATDAKAMQAKAEAYTAKQADLAKAMTAIASDADLATLNDPAAAKDRSFGAFGENQQGFALFTLASAYESGTKGKADLSVAVKKGLLANYPKKPAPDAATYAKALADVKAKVPAQ